MSWFSILPPQLATLEIWLVRFFLLAAILTIGPWLLLIIYDFLLYVFRTLLYEIPYFGGRAHGEQRPPVPSLSERPDGRPRSVSLVGTARSPSRARKSETADTEEGQEEATTAGDVDRGAERERARWRKSINHGLEEEADRGP